MNTKLRDYPFEPDNDWGFFIDLDYDDYEPAYYGNINPDNYETIYYERAYYERAYYERAYYERAYYKHINSDRSTSSSDSIYYESSALYENIYTDSYDSIRYENIDTDADSDADADTCELFNEIKLLFKYFTTTICISGVIIYNYFITNKVSVACC